MARLADRPSEVTAPKTAMPAERLALAESAVRGASPSGGGNAATACQWCSCVADEA